MIFSSITWRLEIGDPTMMGWIICISYFISAFLCLSLSFFHKEEREEALFWGLIGGTLVLLGINKQLDLHTLFLQVGRDLAKAQGWYEYRRTIQETFIGMIAIGGIGALFALSTLMKRHPFRKCPALIGCVFLLCFVLIRTLSFHNFDLFILQRYASVTVNHLFELTGITIVGLTALLHLYPPQKLPVIRSPWFHWGLALFALAVAAMLSHMSTGIPAPFRGSRLGHALEYAVISLILYRAFISSSWENATALAITLSLGFAFLDEVHQILVPGRAFEWGDLLADAFGATVVQGLGPLRRLFMTD